MTSRVVPATSDVIAACRPAKAFNNVDLPILGGPIIATSKPSRTRSATKLPAISAFRSSITTEISVLTSGKTSMGMSSSEKSIVASTSAAARIKLMRQRSTF